ncbi:MAG: universal stress protein [Succinivibrionaceae bacterium]|nr:universal stress protein [Succinivibrionaceae bacterium]
MPHKILVLLKPGEEQPALERASEFARLNESLEVVALRIINKFDESKRKMLEESANSKAEDFRRRYPSLAEMGHKVIFNTDVAGAFIGEAHSGDYAFAVIGANSRNTVRDLFVSPLDNRIMQQVELPLIVVKRGNASSKVENSLLLAIDFSGENHSNEVDEYLYQAARLFSDDFGGEIYVANCIPPTHGAIRSRELEIPNPTYQIPRRADLNEDLLREYAQRHAIPEDHTFVVEGRIDEAIPRLCNQLNVRMVCMGHAGSRGFLESSASELVLEQITGDLFTVNVHLAKKIVDEYRAKHKDHD